MDSDGQPAGDAGSQRQHLIREIRADEWGEVKSLAATLRAESDRGRLLVGLSEIDNLMEKLLMLFFSQQNAERDGAWLLDAKAGYRPLGSLAVRTRIARCLGLIDNKLRNVIDELRGIRNTHAHGTATVVLTDEDLFPVLAAIPKLARESVDDLVKSALSDIQNTPTARLIAVYSLTITEVRTAIIRLESKQFHFEELRKRLDELKESGILS